MMNRRSHFDGIRIQILTAAIVTAVAATAHAGVVVPASLEGPAGATTEMSINGSGSVSNFSISTRFYNLGNFVYVGDLLVGIVAPNGAAVEFGGAAGAAGLSLDGYDGITFANAGVFPPSWQNQNNGNYSHGPVNLASFGLSGTGTYRVIVRNGWASSPGAAWIGTVTLGGLSGFGAPNDFDGDGVTDADDNCPETFNPIQLDSEVPLAALNPLATWRFEEGAGNAAADPIAGHDATLIGAIRVPGSHGDGILLDGSADYASVPASPQLETTNGTIMAWIRPTWASANTGENKMIAGLRDSGGTRYSLHVRRNYSGIDLWNGSVVFSFAGSIPQNQWSHVAVTVGSGTVKCYLNGVQIDGNRSGGFGTQTGRQFRIGGNGTGEFFQGSIDEVALFGRALTAAEIAEITAIGLGDGVGDACDECSVTNVTQDIAYQTIQQAIDASSPGDVIELGACTFNEWGILCNKDLTIRGAGRGLTFIDGDYQGSILRLVGQTTVVEDLTIQRGRPDTTGGAAARLSSGNNTTFRNVDFRDCDSTGFSVGVIFANSSGDLARFESCRFLDNFGGNASAIFGYHASAYFNNCLIARTSGTTALLKSSQNLELTNCTLSDNTFTQWQFFADGTGGIKNCVSNNANLGGGNATMARSLFPGATGDNIDGVPTFVDEANDDYRLAPGSLGIDAADYDAYMAAGGGSTDLNGDPRTLDDSCVADTGSGALAYLDIGAYEYQPDPTDSDGDTVPDACDSCPASPNVWNVTQDTYHPTIQAGIDASAPGDVIELGACTFVERSILLSNSDITIRGQGTDATIIDGAGEGGSILEFRGGDESTIENLSLRNGVANAGNGGGAASLAFSPNVTFRNCRFEGNDSGGHLVGAVVVDTSAAHFERCTFRDNTTRANGIAAAVGTLSGSASFINCLFEGQRSGASVMHYQTGNQPATGSLVNCTFADYDGVQFVRAFGVGTHVDLLNSVFDQSTIAVVVAGGATQTTTHCLFVGATGDNIDGVPTFVDAANGDYRLTPGSLGIDAGDYDAYTTVGGDAMDLSGDPRTFDSCIADTGVGALSYLDIGAYETQDDGSDSDGDGVGDACDLCPGFDDTVDSDGDGVPDGCDVCAGNDALGDSDGDGVCDAPLAIDWDTGVGGTMSGLMCNTEVTIFPVFDGPPAIGDFSGPNYAFAPLSASQERIGYGAATDWTATFDPPVDDLLVYASFWRGAGAGGPDPVTYTFDRPFAIVSGMTGASVTGNTLELPSSAFYSGILRFTGPVSTLSVITSATDSGAGQGLTFAMVTSTVDSDGNGVPDACETSCGSLQLGDVDANGFVEFADAAAMSAILLEPTSGTADQQCAADVNQDGSVNGLDIQAFIGLLLMP